MPPLPMLDKPDISVVIPAKDESESLPELCAWIERVMQENGFSYEVIIIDDGSRDTSWEVINDLSAGNTCVKGIRFNRNYGKSAALDVGFKAAKGRVVITMDADLQDSPDEIPELYNLITRQRYDLISGWKKKRHDPLSKTIPSKFFNYVTSLMSGIRLHDFNCGLKAYNYKVVKAIDVYGEMHRYIPVIAKWQGFTKIGEKEVQHRARKYGVTKFGWERFIFGFLDLLSITFVSKFRKRPMHFFGSLGIFSFVFGMGMAVWLIIKKIIAINKGLPYRNVTDHPLFFLGLVAIIVGAQLFLAGFLGEMMTTIGSKRNEDYLISDKVGL
ncbi:glycosyltransferase family 2 protein [Rhodocytophaga rosea]|nr:glycosyltransferase family 2 protein [Rhodocytophaga rosea]